MKKRLLSLFLALSLLNVPALAAENSTEHFTRSKTYSGQFSDLPENHTFYENVAALYEYGLSVGQADGTYGLARHMTVGQAVIFAGRIRSLYRTGDPETGPAAYTAAAVGLMIVRPAWRGAAVALAGVLVAADLWGVDVRYLSSDDFVSPRRQQWTPSGADKLILGDTTPGFRVLNLTVSPFNDATTSYYHRSVGGYHGAKMSRYQDVIDRYLSSNDEAVLDMLNTRYLILPGADGRPEAHLRATAQGAAWLVRDVVTASTPQQELAALARRKKVFLFEAMTTQYLENYNKIRELLPRIGRVKLVQCNFSQYSSRYDAFCAGETPVSFDPECAGGALMDLNVYNISYIVGLFGEPNQVHYLANMERGIDTSGILTMEYNSFKAVSMAAKDCGAPARYVIQGTKGYILQKSTANWCGGVTFHPNQGKEEHFNLNGGRPRQAAEFHAFAKAIEGGDQELCSRMLDTSVAVSRVLTVARRSADIKFPCDR